MNYILEVIIASDEIASEHFQNDLGNIPHFFDLKKIVVFKGV